MSLFLALAALFASSTAHAGDAAREAQVRELDRARAELADQVQLNVYDLVDELVYGWTSSPPFDTPTPVILGGVTVPVGLGTGLASLVENHLTGVVLANPRTQVRLAHCPSCSAVIVHSSADATVVSRGLDDPALLAELGQDAGRYALFVDVAAEGSWLVLRARITRLTPDLPIVWSQTLSAAVSTRSMLRSPDQLTSAEEAHDAYVDLLRGRGPTTVPFRLNVRTFGHWSGGQSVPPPPLVWLQTGVELEPTPGSPWMSSLVVGGTYIPQAYKGIMLQTRIGRVITGRTRSLTRPDIYAFGGVSMLNLWGPATLPLQTVPVDATQIITAMLGADSGVTLGGLQLGLDMRLGNRIGFAVALERLPNLDGSPNVRRQNVLGMEYQALNTEVTVCF